MACRACRRICAPDDPKILTPEAAALVDAKRAHPHGEAVLVDVKSACCHADVEIWQRTTCSDDCHEEYVRRLEREFGAEKIIVDAVTGLRHRVPTRVLVERGISHDKLARFPLADAG
jgi:hypothetical protein